MRSFCGPRPIRTVLPASSRSSSCVSPRKISSLATWSVPLFHQMGLALVSLRCRTCRLWFGSASLRPLLDCVRQPLPDSDWPCERNGVVVGFAFPVGVLREIDGIVGIDRPRLKLGAGVAQDLLRVTTFRVDSKRVLCRPRGALVLAACHFSARPFEHRRDRFRPLLRKALPLSLLSESCLFFLD